MIKEDEFQAIKNLLIEKGILTKEEIERETANVWYEENKKGNRM